MATPYSLWPKMASAPLGSASNLGTPLEELSNGAPG
jgi:hypothetical protein